MSGFPGADALPIRPVDSGDQVRISHAHYMEISQARRDDAVTIARDAETIKQMRLYIEIQMQTEDRLKNELVLQRESIIRLQNDRRDLLSALREIHESGPDHNPTDGFYDDTIEQAEARGYDKAAWDSGQIARQVIDKVGAAIRVDIPRRKQA